MSPMGERVEQSRALALQFRAASAAYLEDDYADEAIDAGEYADAVRECIAAAADHGVRVDPELIAAARRLGFPTWSLTPA